MPKTILCYGDSNTWGYVPGSGGQRYPHAVRWTGILGATLGRDYRVVEEGLNGRTTAWDDLVRPDRNGKDTLPMLLESHAPLDRVVIMLGTNDLKHYFGKSAHDIALAAGALASMVRASAAGPNGTAPDVLLVAPPRLVPSAALCRIEFDGAIEKSMGFPEAFAAVADRVAVDWLDAGSVVETPDTDGAHFDERGHAALGRAVASRIQGLDGG